MTPGPDDPTGADDLVAARALARRAVLRRVVEGTLCGRRFTHPRHPTQSDRLGYLLTDTCICLRPAGLQHYGCICEHGVYRIGLGMEQSHILVVHDDRKLRDGLHQAFRAAGYKSVVEAKDEAEGLEVFRRERPSLVVTDLKSGGLDLLQRVRQEDPDAAVIVLTRAPEVKAAIASLKLGAHAFLMQPINRDELLLTSERALERRQLLVEHRLHQPGHGLLQGIGARNVLILDDDPAVSNVLRQIFEGAGYTCRLSGAGYKALEMFKAWRPPLVVTDIRHPGLSAFELLREVRAVDGDVAVIVLTGAADTKTLIASLKLGADAFLMKPVNVDEFLITVERALERRQLLIERRKRQEGA